MTVFKGLAGNLEVTQKGTLPGIGQVYYNARAITSIISASECIRRGHEWEFQKGQAGGADAFLLHTTTGSYRFALRDGLYVCDLTGKREHRSGRKGTSPDTTVPTTPTTAASS